MAFADTLRPASFRGVAFLVDGDSAAFGRRTVTHLFPLRDDPAHEDLGARPRAFSVEAVLIGDDVAARARRLEAALEAPGPGRLVHPWYGELLAVVTEPVRVRHDATRQGRVVRITIGFERAGVALPADGVADTALALLSQGEAVLDAMAGEVAGALDLSGALDFVAEATAGLVGGLGDVLDGVAATAAVALPAAVVEGIAGVKAVTAAALAMPLTVVKGVTGTALALADLAVAPLQPALAPVASFAAGVAAAALKVASGLLKLCDWPATLPAVAGATASRLIQARAQGGLALLAEAAGAAGAARAVARATFDSREQALAWRDRVGDRLDAAADRAGAAGCDAAWRGLTGLRAALVRDLSRRGADLPRLAAVVPAAVGPALVVAQRLYGDEPETLFKRAADIARRNGLAHPGFAPSGRLEVLTDG